MRKVHAGHSALETHLCHAVTQPIRRCAHRALKITHIKYDTPHRGARWVWEETQAKFWAVPTLFSAPEGANPGKCEYEPAPPSTVAHSFVHGAVSKVNTEQTPKIANVAKKGGWLGNWFECSEKC